MAKVKPFKYKEQHIKYLHTKTVEETWKVFGERFNKKFNTSLNLEAIKRAAQRNGVKKSYSCKGKPSWNKGMKGLDCAGENGRKTQFKKGRDNNLKKPIGSEREFNDYTLVKVEQPNIWRLKHYLIWEEAYGPVPDGHIILFLDGNRKNLSLDNMECVSKAQAGIMNLNGLISENPEVTKTGILLASISNKITQRKREVKI